MKGTNELIFEPNPLLFSKQEKTRLKYKPKKIRYLFVAESMPVGGNFFYFEIGDLFKYTKKTFIQNFNWAEQDFLKFFMSNGFYLDDLCLEPVNQLSDYTRKFARKAYEECLTKRIKKYEPLIVVTLLKSIAKNVKRTINNSGIIVNNIAITSPFQGGQNKYVEELDWVIKNKIKPLFKQS